MTSNIPGSPGAGLCPRKDVKSRGNERFSQYLPTLDGELNVTVNHDKANHC